MKRYCSKCGLEMRPDTSRNIAVGMWIHFAENDEEEEHETYHVYHYDACSKCAGKVIGFITGHDMDTEIP